MATLALRGSVLSEQRGIRSRRRIMPYKTPSPKMTMTVTFVCLVISTFQSIGIGISAYAVSNHPLSHPKTSAYIEPVAEDRLREYAAATISVIGTQDESSSV